MHKELGSHRAREGASSRVTKCPCENLSAVAHVYAQPFNASAGRARGRPESHPRARTRARPSRGLLVRAGSGSLFRIRGERTNGAEPRYIAVGGVENTYEWSLSLKAVLRVLSRPPENAAFSLTWSACAVCQTFGTSCHFARPGAFLHSFWAVCYPFPLLFFWAAFLLLPSSSSSSFSPKSTSSSSSWFCVFVHSLVCPRRRRNPLRRCRCRRGRCGSPLRQRATLLIAVVPFLSLPSRGVRSRLGRDGTRARKCHRHRGSRDE